MARVECVDLQRVFSLRDGGEEVAVDSISVTIEEGEFTTVVGPSGCGKTTFLRMIAGLETPTSGEIRFDGEPVTDISPQSRELSMVFQSIALFPFRTVRSNIEYGLKYADVPTEEVKQRVEEMASMVGIEELLDKKPPQLSGGQQQRAALARALIRDPEVFLLDEPLSDLDAKLKTEMRTELKELHQQFPKTTIYVTHDQQEAMTLSDSVIVLNDGRIMQKAPPEKVYSAPENTFVAQFIGSPTINMFEATLESGALVADALQRAVPIAEELQARIREKADGGLQLGVRPNDLTRTEDGAEAFLEGSVKVFEQMGDETILHLILEGTDREIRVSVPPSVIPEQGDQFQFTFDHGDAHLFDRETGEAITNGLDIPKPPA